GLREGPKGTRILDGPGWLGDREYLGEGKTILGVSPQGITMNQTEIKAHRRQLLALRDRQNRDVTHLSDEAFRKSDVEASGHLSQMPIHRADVATANSEEENTLNLLPTEDHILGEIAAALDRIDNGTLGRCEECQGDILPKARLKELPYTRYCVECARK